MTRLAEGDLLTVPQALRLLPVAKRTIYRLIADGEIPAIRVASAGSRRGRLLIHRDDLEAYVARLRGETALPPPARADPDAILARIRRERRA